LHFSFESKLPSSHSMFSYSKISKDDAEQIQISSELSTIKLCQ